MSMFKKIEEDIAKAMKGKDSVSLSVLRDIKTACTIAEKAVAKADAALNDLEIVGIIRKKFQQRVDSMEQYKKANRKDLYDKEHEELEVLRSYLPQELPEHQIEQIIDDVMVKIENPTIKNMGQIMKEVTTIVNGRADNKKISEMIRSKLS